MITWVNIYTFFFYLSLSSAIIPIIVCFFNYRAFNKQLNALFIYLGIAFVIEIVSVILLFNKITNTLVLHLFTLLEGLFIFFIYKQEFKNKTIKKNIFVMSIIYFITSISSLIYNKEDTSLDQFTSILECTFIIGLAITFFYNVFVNLNIPKLTSYYFFWFNSAFLIYFSTTFFLFLFENFLNQTDPLTARFLWAVHLFMNIVYNILLSIGICKVRQI